MILSKEGTDNTEVDVLFGLTASKRRRLRRKKLQAARAVGLESITSVDSPFIPDQNESKSNLLKKKQDNCAIKVCLHHNHLEKAEEVNSVNNHTVKQKLEENKQNLNHPEKENQKKRKNNFDLEKVKQEENRGISCCSELSKSDSMSTKDAVSKSREEVLAAREAKKLSKQKVKQKLNAEGDKDETQIENKLISQEDGKNENINKEIQKEEPVPNMTKQIVVESTDTPQTLAKAQIKIVESPKSKDEVDRAIKLETAVDNDRDKVKAERAAKKAAKLAKKKGVESVDKEKDLTVKDVVETLRDIVNVAKEMKDVTAKVNAINLEPKKSDESKSKAELKAERRAKQEAQRAAKQVAQQEKVAAKPKPEHVKPAEIVKEKEKTPTKSKVADKPKVKSQGRVNWFQHLYTDHDKESLKKIAINSNLHPAVIKLGAQLAARVVTGSNARCVALLNALKQMVRDYTLPAKTEFGRGLDSHLAASLDFLWAMRQPSASQTNAVKFFRHHLTQLPNNVDEFDAKKTLQEEIDRYIREQIDMAGEAISIAVRNKISNGDNILTYGCSSLIERILREAWGAGVKFRAVVVGNRVHSGGREMLRRLVAAGLPCTYIDITAVSFIMNTISKVVVGASSLLVDGSVLGAVGTAQVALLARARNVPVLVACETHKFCGRVQTDAFVYNEIGDPDDLVDKSDENSPLKDWRSNPNLTPLNLTYDVTPPSLVTAVITELAILPCTSAPVVLRFKLSEYGI